MNETALLQHPVLRALRRAVLEGGIADGPLLLAVSGGRDSTALAGAMSLLQGRNEVGLLRMAHVHHHQRDASDDEAELVRRTAAALELPLEVLHLDVPRGASPARLREARYDALREEAMRCRADALLTGHHADDQLETLLLALVRGAGPGGLAGMPCVRGLGDTVRLVRPLLGASRQDLGDLCDRMGLEYCDDPGNVDADTLRGRLRRDVIPVLDSLRSGVAARAAVLAPVQGAAAAALKALVPRPDDGVWDRISLARLPHAVRLAALHAAAIDLAQVDAISTPALVDAADAIADARMHRRVFEVGGGIELVLEAHRLRISRSSPDRP